MVDKIKLLENLVESVSTMSNEICYMDEERFNETQMWLDKATGLMRGVYERIKNECPNEPIVNLIGDNYDDAWDVLYPSVYEKKS